MPITATCSSCRHSFQAASKFAGKKVKCPKCKSAMVVPGGKNGATAATKIAVQCQCGQKFAAKPELAGRKVKCPGCGNPILIKATGKTKASAEGNTANSESSMDDLFDEVGFAPTDGRGKKCPECKSPMKPEAIICIDCGYNENLGRRMKVKRPVTAAERAKRSSSDEAADTSKSKKKGGWFRRS